MKKLKQLFRKFHNKNQGLTLVEMIVTFMLIGLFMIAASKVIANTVSVYYTAKGTANGMQVSSIIASKIRGEIEGARDATITTEVKNEDGTTSEVTSIMIFVPNAKFFGAAIVHPAVARAPLAVIGFSILLHLPQQIGHGQYAVSRYSPRY